MITVVPDLFGAVYVIVPFAFQVIALVPDGSEVIVEPVSTAPETPERTLIVDVPFFGTLPVVCVGLGVGVGLGLGVELGLGVGVGLGVEDGLGVGAGGGDTVGAASAPA